jgi:hypothetical protein
MEPINPIKPVQSVLGTTGGVLGAKAAVVTNEVVDQTADFGMSFAVNIGRSRLASKIGNATKSAIANASTDEAKAKRAARIDGIKANISSATKAVAAKIPVSAEIVESVKTDSASIKERFALIDNGPVQINEPMSVISERPCPDCHGAPEVHDSCDCAWADQVRKEVDEDRVRRMREEEDRAAIEAGCALYDHEEFIDGQ